MPAALDAFKCPHVFSLATLRDNWDVGRVGDWDPNSKSKKKLSDAFLTCGGIVYKRIKK